MRPSEPKWRDPNVVTPPSQIERAEPSRGAPEAERKAFEEWAEESYGGDAQKFFAQHFNPKFMAEPEYIHLDVQWAWKAWQYRANQASGHVVLLEALKEMREVNAVCFRAIATVPELSTKLGDELTKLGIKPGFGTRAEAAIQQAERT